MKCRACSDSIFLIKTNPKDRCFDYVTGIKKKVEEFDTVEALSLGVIETDVDANGSGNIVPFSLNRGNQNDPTNSKERNNPMDKLENVAKGERKALTERDEMEALYNLQSRLMYDDAASNSVLRSKYRIKRKETKKLQKETESLGLGKGILLSSKEEVKVCELESMKRKHERSEKKVREEEKSRWHKVRSGSIFSGAKYKFNKNKPRNKGGCVIVDKVPKHKGQNSSNRTNTWNKKVDLSLNGEENKERGLSIREKGEDVSPIGDLFNYASDSD